MAVEALVAAVPKTVRRLVLGEAMLTGSTLGALTRHTALESLGLQVLL